MNKVIRVGCFDRTMFFQFDDDFYPKYNEEFLVYKIDDRYILNAKYGYFEISHYEFDLGFYVIEEKPFIPYLEEYKSKRKRIVEPSWNSVPKSVREAEEWALRFLNIGHVDYTGFDLKIASEINFQIFTVGR